MCRRSNLFVLLLICAAIHLGLGATKAHAVDAKYLCNSAGSQCVSMTPTKWRFYPEKFGGYPVPGNPFSSFSEAQSALEATFYYCEWTNTGNALDHVPGPWITSGQTSPLLSYGIPYMRQHRMYYTAKLTPCPASGTPYSNIGLNMLQTRDIKCPSGYTRIYSAGPPVIGPYCANPWSEADPGKCPDCKGGVNKGNPIEIASGNKRQRESDYRASGASPLEFTRYFNSWQAAAIGNSTDPTTAGLPPAPVGVAWTATYFQSIRYYDEGAIASAFVFRPDGERIPFNETGGIFQPAADMDYTLSAQRDSLGAITGWTLK
ncbi:MAG TPA: DUF6531 domain-containing protein, partial [Steroidobacteraceae bacterium]|nr:DUF6531 domain-containing protein [Steroidobacteraceae bacterium]